MTTIQPTITTQPRGRPRGSGLGNHNGRVGRPKKIITETDIQLQKERNRAKQREIYYRHKQIILDARLVQQKKDNIIKDALTLFKSKMDTLELDELKLLLEKWNYDMV